MASEPVPWGEDHPGPIHNTLDDVLLFMEKANQLTEGKFPYGPPETDVFITDIWTLHLPALRALRVKLLDEEFEECLRGEEYNDLAEIIDGLIDIIWIAMGSLLAYIGPDATNACLREVSRANMSKVIGDGLPKFREDGKVLKPEGFEPPNIKRILQSLGKM